MSGGSCWNPSFGSRKPAGRLCALIKDVHGDLPVSRKLSLVTIPQIPMRCSLDQVSDGDRRATAGEKIATSDFTATPINEGLVKGLTTGAFLADQRNAALVSITGTDKSHLAVAIGRSCVRTGARVRYYNTIDLVNRLKAESRASRIAEHLSRLDFVILEVLGNLPLGSGPIDVRGTI
jgi:hypothetical protein